MRQKSTELISPYTPTTYTNIQLKELVTIPYFENYHQNLHSIEQKLSLEMPFPIIKLYYFY